MQKKIAVARLRQGMFVDRLVGSWLDHPFWKKSFRVDARALAQLKASAVREVWIDTIRGLDVDDLEEPSTVDDELLKTMIIDTPEPDAVEACETIAFGDLAFDGPTSFDEELGHARRIVKTASAAMRTLLDDARLGRALDAEQCLPLVDEIARSIDRNPAAIVSLARLKTSGDYTYMHSVAVCVLMVALARKAGMPDTVTREAGIAGLVHDVGKVFMPTEILDKPGPLTNEEFAVMRGHPEAGHALLREANGVGASAMDVCLHHHEKMNGRGYPFGLAGDRISLLARMGAVCDVYDAITSNRPYKAGWDPALSVQKMAQWSREGHFDDRVFQVFVKSIGIYPVGSLVRLSSNRIAVVVDQVPGKLLTPVVATLLDCATRRTCESVRIDLSADGSPRIVSREIADAWGLTSIDDHWQAPAAVAA